MKRVLFCFVATASLAFCGTASAEINDRDLRIIGSEPIAPRGGVLVTRLTSEKGTVGWPSTVVVRLDTENGDALELTGHIGWMESEPLISNRPWSWSGSNLQIRPVEPSDDITTIRPGNSLSGPYLLVELPEHGSGPLVVGKQRAPVRWIDLPPALPFVNLGEQAGSLPELKAVNAPNRPLVDDPFTWWRWVLLADRHGYRPPPPPETDVVTLLLAKHVAQMWRIGFDRLAQRSRGIAAQCRNLLTCTCMDDDVEFAAWINDSNSINELLTIMLDPANEELMDELALSWTDRQIPMVAWVEQSYGEDVSLAVGNPFSKKQLAQVLWNNRGSVPIGEALAPNLVTRISLERPPSGVIAKFYPEIESGQLLHMNLVISSHVMTLVFGPDTVPVKPPGALIGPFHPPLTLATARTQFAVAAPEQRSTWCQVRRIANRWELFLECERPHRAQANMRISSFMRSLEQLRGIEGVTILMGPPRHDRAPAQFGICIPEQGDPVVIIGPSDTPPEVHIQSYEDRWLARFVVPWNWLPDQDEPLLLGLIRTHGDNLDFETAPNTSVPWKIHIDPIHLDLTSWDSGDLRMNVRPTRP